MKYKIELIKIRREKVNRIKIVNVKNLQSVEKIALKEVKKYLISTNVALFPRNNKYVYAVYAGFQYVGEVKITKLK